MQWYVLKVEAVVQNLEKALEFVNTGLERINCSEKVQNQIAIVVEEIFVNIAYYAYNPETGSATIRMVISDNEIELEFEDYGKPYNPLENADPDITASAEERPIGGLGIFMVKKIMDTIDYRYAGGMNILTLKKKIG